MTSTNRMTGLATGLDIDSIIEGQMKNYQIRIDKKTQDKEVMQIKQKLYRDVLDSANDFYNKYLDLTKDTSILKSNNYGSIGYASSNNAVASATCAGSTSLDNYNVKVTQIATPATAATIKIDDIVGNDTVRINYLGKTIDVEVAYAMNDIELVRTLNSAIRDRGLSAKYSEFAGGIVIESQEKGAHLLEGDNNFTMEIGRKVGDVFTATSTVAVEKGKSIHATLTKTNTNPPQVIELNDSMNISGNSFTVDGIKFNFNSVGETDISSSRDVTKVAENITKFITDYNTLVEKLNTLVIAKHDRSYTPLTAAQKKEMSESEIKLWNEKVENGQLSRDGDISRILTSLRTATIDPVEASGLYLEKIGIKPVKDYAGKRNGTFEIDQEKLKSALEANTEGVMNLFISVPSNTAGLSDAEKYNKKGIFQRVKDILYSETVSSSSYLSEKAGLKNTSTFTNNELTTKISQYETALKTMQKDFTRKQQALYSKWAGIEKQMNNYNTQQSYLTSQFGGNS